MSIPLRTLNRLKESCNKIADIEGKFMIFKSELKNYYHLCMWDDDVNDWDISETKIGTFCKIHLRCRKFSISERRKGFELTSNGIVDIIDNNNN